MHNATTPCATLFSFFPLPTFRHRRYLKENLVSSPKIWCWPHCRPCASLRFGLTCPVARMFVSVRRRIASIQWFHAAWSLSAGVAKAAAAAHVPRPDHATNANSILGKKGDLVLAYAHPLKYIFFKYRSSLVIIPSSAISGTVGCFPRIEVCQQS